MAWHTTRKMGVRVEVRPTWVDPSAPSSSKQLRPSDTALASPGLWRHLRAREDAANVETSVFVSIQVPIDRRLGSKGQRRHLIVEVKQDSTVSQARRGASSRVDEGSLKRQQGLFFTCLNTCYRSPCPLLRRAYGYTSQSHCLWRFYSHSWRQMAPMMPRFLRSHSTAITIPLISSGKGAQSTAARVCRSRRKATRSPS